MRKIRVKDIVKAYLLALGYDGLHRDADCGCVVDDLIPCSEDSSMCQPGYKHGCPEGHEFDWIIADTKDSPFDD